MRGNRASADDRFHARDASNRAIASATFRWRETNRRSWPAGPWGRAAGATLHRQPGVLGRRGVGLRPAIGESIRAVSRRAQYGRVGVARFVQHQQV
jgi:hypothetical protein